MWGGQGTAGVRGVRGQGLFYTRFSCPHHHARRNWQGRARGQGGARGQGEQGSKGK